MAITRQEIVPHVPINNLTDHGTRVPSFQFSSLRPGDGPLLPPPSDEEYVLQYVNYQTHGYHDISGLYSTDTDTVGEDNVNRDVKI